MAKVTNYGTLKTAISDWLARGDLSDYTDQFVQFAENQIYSDPELRLRQMEKQLDGFVGCDGKMDVPDDYLELKHAYLDKSPRIQLERCDPAFIYETYGTRFAGLTPFSDTELSDSSFAYGNGVPKYIATEGDTFILAPFPSDQYRVGGIYYKKFTALNAESDTNWLLTNHPDLYLYGALMQAEPFIKNDSRIMLWEKMYERARARVRGSERRERFSGGIAVRAV